MDYSFNKTSTLVKFLSKRINTVMFFTQEAK
ncbi:hypothetical protein ECP03047775_4862, partial [Escherichia coli P0304777.5]